MDSNFRPTDSSIKTAVKAMEVCKGDRDKAASRLHKHACSLAKILRFAKEEGYEFPDKGPASGKTTASRKATANGLSDMDRQNLKALGRDPAGGDFRETQHGVSKEEIESMHFRYGGRLNVFLAHRNFAAARSLIDQAEREQSGEGDGLEAFGDIPLVATEIMRQVVNQLDVKANAIYLKDLLTVDASTMLSWPNFGPKSMDNLLRNIIHLAMQRDQLRAIAEMRLREISSGNGHGK